MKLDNYSWGNPASSKRILFIHGLTSAGHSWGPVARSLVSAGWYAEAMDLPGHGRSPANPGSSLEDIGDSGLASPQRQWDVVVGHSLGGAVALHVAARRPDLVLQLLLIDPLVLLPERDIDPFVWENLAALEDDYAITRRQHPRWSDPAILSKLIGHAQADPICVSSVLRANGPWDLRPVLGEVEIAVNILGADPAVEEPSATEDLAPYLNRHSRFEKIAGASHSIHRDFPDLVTNRILGMSQSDAGAG